MQGELIKITVRVAVDDWEALSVYAYNQRLPVSLALRQLMHEALGEDRNQPSYAADLAAVRKRNARIASAGAAGGNVRSLHEVRS